MPRSSSERLHYSSSHRDSVSANRVVGLIAIDETFAECAELSGQEVPWEVLVGNASQAQADADWVQVVADVDRLAQELAAEFAAIVGKSI